MTYVAPNLSSLVGSDVAARLISAAGGVHSLAKIPACNVMTLGAPKKELGGYTHAHTKRCVSGYISQSDVIKRTPPSHQLKVTRMIANKVVLATRMDAEHTCTYKYGLREREREREREIDRERERERARDIDER